MEQLADSANLGGKEFVDTALQALQSGSAGEPSLVKPMPGVLGESSSSKDDGADDARTPPAKGTDAESIGRHRVAGASTIEVSEDEFKGVSPPRILRSQTFKELTQEAVDAGKADAAPTSIYLLIWSMCLHICLLPVFISLFFLRASYHVYFSRAYEGYWGSNGTCRCRS